MRKHEKTITSTILRNMMLETTKTNMPRRVVTSTPGQAARIIEEERWLFRPARKNLQMIEVLNCQMLRLARIGKLAQKQADAEGAQSQSFESQPAEEVKNAKADKPPAPKEARGKAAAKDKRRGSVQVLAQKDIKEKDPVSKAKLAKAEQNRIAYE